VKVFIRSSEIYLRVIIEAKEEEEETRTTDNNKQMFAKTIM